MKSKAVLVNTIEINVQASMLKTVFALKTCTRRPDGTNTRPIGIYGRLLTDWYERPTQTSMPSVAILIHAIECNVLMGRDKVQRASFETIPKHIGAYGMSMGT
eukprot:4440647-Pleurochrysis_carterae.AAC.1